MAFPIPSHLPRRAPPQDVSSQILSKIDSATNQTLNSALVSSWLTELEVSIQTTKERIHERVNADLPAFKRQSATSKSVQERLRALSNNVDGLNETLNNQQNGLIPTLLRNLTNHATLAQEALNADGQYQALSHLQRCRTELGSLKMLVQSGKLPDAVEGFEVLDRLLGEAPVSLNQAHIMTDMRSQSRSTKAWVEELLSDAYSRGLVVSPSELTIITSIQITKSSTILPLSAILSSLSSAALTNHLTTLRRDLMTQFVDRIFTQPLSVTSSSSNAFEHKLAVIPSPPNTEIRSSRLENVAILLDFLSAHLFPSLPPSQAPIFTRSLCKPLTTSLLNNFLIPSLPSSFGLLPPFLALVQQAVAFENQYIIDILSSDNNDLPIQTWANGVSGHYERQRRLEILEKARVSIIAPEDLADSFRMEVDVLPEEPSVVPVQAVDSPNDSKDDAWGFEDESSAFDSADDGSWGLDDDMPLDPAPDAIETGQQASPVPPPRSEDALEEDNTDPGDAWGWNDDMDDTTLAVEPTDGDAETAWDDPWGGPSQESPEDTEMKPPPAPSIAPAKIATRLEKLASKGKKKANGEVPQPLPAAVPNSTHPPAIMVQPSLSEKTVGKRPSRLVSVATPKETYLVSARMKQIISIVESILDEGKQFGASKLVPASATSSVPGTVILQSAASVLDLYRGLYPVKFSKDLKSPERRMRFSNDLLYLSGEVERIEGSSGGSSLKVVKDRLVECRHCLKVLSSSVFDEAVQTQRQAVDEILAAGTEGFTFTGDQDRYDECESAITQVVREIRVLAQKLKYILSKSKYYIAIGSIVDAALSRILDDILALPDIPEVESHRLSELCRIMNALEGLFVEDPEQPSFVVAYVPSWLKYSYLSELLEASMADISYLFEEGALVDFDVEELARLVRALFADTPLRSTTISKLLNGHPSPRQ